MEQVSKYTTSKPRRCLADAWIARRLLNARGWTLICVAEHEWLRMRNFEEKVEFVEGKINEILNPQLGAEKILEEPVRQIAWEHGSKLYFMMLKYCISFNT